MYEGSLAKIKVGQIWRNTAATRQCIPDLEQHHCSNRTVYGSFRSEDSRCGATPLLRDCVRVNSSGTGKSKHIPDLEEHAYLMLLNTFVRVDNPDLKQHRCYGTEYGSIRFIITSTIFVFFCVAFILKHLAWRSSISKTSHCLHSTEDVL